MARAVVVGAGPDGMTAAARMRELLNAPDQVVLVDRRARQALGAGQVLLSRGPVEPVALAVAPSMLGRRGVEFVRSEVTGIRTRDRVVDTSAGRLGYDALVIALGAALDAPTIPGVSEAPAAGVAARTTRSPEPRSAGPG